MRLLTGELFIAYEPDTGVIKYVDALAENIWPLGLSVRGVDSVPDGCSEDGTWCYDSVTQTITRSVELTIALKKPVLRAKLQAVAAELALLDLESPDDVKAKREMLKQYVADLRAAHVSVPFSEWPPAPEFMN